MARISNFQFSILSLGVFLQAAREVAVKHPSFICMIASCKFRGAILQVPFLLIKELFFSTFSNF